MEEGSVMRVRIKFSKQEPMQYIGHLDTMRYFQKVLRRADLPVAFSEGFSPHILMSFASPLGVGKTSTGEYFDLDLREPVSCAEIAQRMKQHLSDGFTVTAVSEIEESKRSNGMRVIAAASYRVRTDRDIPVSEERIRMFMEQEHIDILRKTKRKEELTDIRPWIYDFRYEDNSFSMLLSAGSVQNLKPDPVMHAYEVLQGVDPDSCPLHICRTELYAERTPGSAPDFIPLLECGCIDETGVYRE